MEPPRASLQPLLALQQGLANTSDQELSRQICDRAPTGTYTSVYVEAIQSYHFGAGRHRPCRLITLTRSSPSQVGAILRAFFMAIFGKIDEERALYANRMVNSTDIAASLVRGNEQLEGNEEIRKAFYTCRKIRIYLSEDGLVDIEVGEQDTYVIRSHEMGMLIRTICPW